MRIFTLTILTVAASLLAANPSNADDDISKDDGVVYLESTEAGVAEKFDVYRDGNEIEIEHSIYLNAQWVEINNKDYFINSVDRIHFVGDGDTDFLIVADGDTLGSVEIPVIAYGNGADDLLIGGASQCVLYGGSGNDVLYGSDGQDYLDPGDGVSAVLGNGGADVFILWQHYVWNKRTGKWELELLTDISDTDYDFIEDSLKLKVKSKYSNLPVTTSPLTPQSAESTSKYYAR